MKSIIFVVLLIFRQITDEKAALSCGKLQTTLVPRITNTNETMHRWPWHVALFHQVNESSSAYQCGGTLISSNSILTAAHCVSIDAKEVTVSLGRMTLDASESSAPFIKVAEIIRHPNYNSENQENDIAIVLLSTNATFNNYVQPICLWKDDRTDLSEIVDKNGTVVGWGRTETGEVSNALRQASLPVVNFTTCLKSNRDLFGRFLSDKNFCAGSRNGTSVCAGDSGGSMTFEENGIYHIRGIVSVGPSKVNTQTQEIVCDPMQYAVFTDVGQYLPWIKDTAKMMECDTRVRCQWGGNNHCTVVINVNFAQPECQIIIDEVSNAAVTMLTINGQSDVNPELSDAVAKFKNLDNLALVDIHLKSVQRAGFTPFGNIKKLNLSSNSISQFDTDTFDDLNNLVELHISFNKLKELHPNLFRELSNLEVLHLNNNSLEVLPLDIFRNNIKVTEIFLSENQLEEIHVDLFKDLRNLEILGLQGNNLETIPPQIFRNNVKMRYIGLSRNQFKELHADLFEDLLDLEILYVNSNKFQVLPGNIFRNNGKLRELSLSRNQLKELNVDLLKDLRNLEIIHLSHNQLEIIPTGIFRDNEKLTHIYLEYNKIKIIDPDFYQMTQVAILGVLDFRENVCIDEACGYDGSCDVLSLFEIAAKIKINCVASPEGIMVTTTGHVHTTVLLNDDFLNLRCILLNSCSTS